jgi:hypothetical protein
MSNFIKSLIILIMKFLTREILFLILLLTLCVRSYSQTIIINDEESDGKLAWSDFTGEVDNNSDFSAYTSYRFKLTIGKDLFSGDSALIEKVRVILELDQKNSWAKMAEVNDELLIHEQGHFNFGIMYMNEILNRLKKAKLTRENWKSQVDEIFEETSSKYRVLELKYDEETDHSRNRIHQRKWNDFFLLQLSN